MPRPSHVRDAIAELVGTSDRHDWTIEDVTAALTQRGVVADPSSVFRGLNRLCEKGALERVTLGDGKTRFEARRAHHEHLVCAACGAVDAVPGCLVENAIARVERDTGWHVTGHRLLLSGLCGPCSEAG